MARPHIGVDARLYGTKHRGLGRYTAELVSALALCCDRYDFSLFVNDLEEAEAAALRQQGFTLVAAPYRAYSAGEQFVFPGQIRRAHLDLMHYPHLNVPLSAPQPFVVTIHDLILHHYPTRYASTLPPVFYWMKYAAYRFVTRQAIGHARFVLAVSHFTAEDIENYYPHTRNRLKVIPEVVSVLNHEDLRNDTFSDVLYTQYRPFLLVVGAFYPHKNLERLLRVWQAIMPTQRLVLVGRLDVFGERLKQQAAQRGLLANRPGGVIFLDAVNDANLAKLYQQAEALIVPSLMEGVGLPGLEALSYGTPVISSAASSLPEMYGRHATYIPCENDQEMIQALRPLLRMPPARLSPLPSTMTRDDLATSLSHVYDQALR